MRESCNATASVSAHRPQTSVGIIVFHLEIKRLRSQFSTLQRHQSVGTHSETAVAEMGNLFFGEVNRAVTVVHHNEVIPCPIKFIEFHIPILIS